MKYALTRTACVAFILILTFPAYGADMVQELKISRLGDVEMGCGALSQEAALMRDIIITTQDIKEDSELKGHGITAAGAVGSFLVGSVTGGIGLAAAGFLLDRQVEEESENADSVQDIAEQRRSLMTGIYNAKGCFGPVDHALQDGIERQPGDTRFASMEPSAGDPDDEPHYNE